MSTLHNAADTLAGAFATGRQIAPFSDTDANFDLASGYGVQNILTARRVAAGARVVGLKVGFTNTQIWAQFNIGAPIHGPVFDTTLASDPADISALLEPLIEPEIVLKLRATPHAEMDDVALLACVEAIAPGFELVQSAFPGWRFTAADSVASGAMHGALVLGDWVPVDADWLAPLNQFTVTLSCDGAVQDTGVASNLLGGGPIAVLRHLVGLPSCPPLAAGALISTGTVTRALPIAQGQTWHARFTGLPLAAMSLRLR